jgi:tol-pal system protein YbgF
MLVLLPIAIFLLGFASVRDVKILDREIDKIYSKLNALQKENSSLENRVSALSDENQKLKAELLIRIDNLQSQVQTLSIAVAEYKDYFERSSKEIGRTQQDGEVRLKMSEEKRKSLEEKNRTQEERIREMENRLKNVEVKAKQAEAEKSNVAKDDPSDTRRGPEAIEEPYRDAYEAFQKGDFEGSKNRFEAFLKQYPNVRLSGNAQFWIGEIYYQKRDYEKAILEYEKTMNKYPESGKIPAASFKQALAFLELGDKKNARNLLKGVVERFPHSDQCDMAKRKLEKIN